MGGNFFQDLDHVGNSGETPSHGPSIGFFDQIGIGYDQQRNVDSGFGLEADLLDQYNDTLKAYRDLTGRDLEQVRNGLDAMTVVARTEKNLPAATALVPTSIANDYLGVIARNEEKLNELRQNNPDAAERLKPIAQIYADILHDRGNVISRSEQAGQNRTWSGLAGNLIGATLGSLSFQRDPLLTGSLFLGGGGSTIARRIGSEMVVAGSVGAAQHYLFNEPTRQVTGEPDQGAASTILGFALSAGLIRGASEATGPALRALFERTGLRLPQLHEGFNFEDSQLREMFDHLPETPSVRAAQSLLDDAAHFRASNPYGEGHLAEQQFLTDLSEAHAAFNGETAIGRTLPEQDLRLPATYDEALARGERPDLVDELDRAKESLTQAQSAVSAISETLDGRRISDAVSLVGENSGKLVRAIEDKLAEPNVPAIDRAKLVKRLNDIVEELGPEYIANAENYVNRKAKSDLQTANAARKVAQQSYNRAASAVAEVVRKAKVKEDILQRLKAPKGPPTEILRRDSREVSGASPAQRSETLAEVPEQVSKMEEEIPTSVEQFQKSGLVEEEGQPTHVLLDDGTKVPGSFIVDFGDEKISAADIFRDAADLDAQIENMKVCGL